MLIRKATVLSSCRGAVQRRTLWQAVTVRTVFPSCKSAVRSEGVMQDDVDKTMVVGGADLQLCRPVRNLMADSQGGVHCESLLEVGQQGIERGRSPGRRGNVRTLIVHVIVGGKIFGIFAYY
jgi:hypothetical protein